MKAKVLIVEDSRSQREHLSALLTSLAYDVTSVAGGIEALAKIKTAPPDIVLLDVMLDGMDGYSVCRWLRLGETTRDIIVIMLTAKGEVKERVEGLHVGADDYIAKPFDADELEARMFAALRSRTTRIELRQRNAELETLLTRTERLAMTDPLTGVFNRRRFTDVLRREWATSKRYRVPLTLMLLDVDRFKNVNDAHGHAAGDEVLRVIADVLSTSIREVDVCARYGGDEFALLLPHTDAEPATIVAERIRAKVAHARAALAGEARHVSLSIGVASTAPSLATQDDLVEAADRALYEAKRRGRDCVVIAKEEMLVRSGKDLGQREAER